MAAGNTLEAVLGALLLQAPRFLPPRSRATQDVLALTAAAATCTLVSALTGALSLVWTGQVAWGGFALHHAWVWWLGNAMGALVVAPVLLLLSRPRPGAALARRRCCWWCSPWGWACGPSAAATGAHR